LSEREKRVDQLSAPWTHVERDLNTPGKTSGRNNFGDATTQEGVDFVSNGPKKSENYA